jgi:hypothetical protein
MNDATKVTIRTDNLRVQDGAQGRGASAGSYAKGTYVTVAHQTYGQPWVRIDTTGSNGERCDRTLTAADIALLDAAPRVHLCG